VTYNFELENEVFNHRQSHRRRVSCEGNPVWGNLHQFEVKHYYSSLHEMFRLTVSNFADQRVHF